MAILVNVPRQQCARLANGLAGVADRWRGGQNHWQDARQIYQQITAACPQIKALVNAKLLELQATFQNATPQQWDEALTYISNSIARQGGSSASFGPGEWLTYLVARRRPFYDVVFIGGGPIGLWTAILAKIQHVALSILVLEKRTTYTRHHGLSIDEESFVTYPAGKEFFLDNLVNDFKLRKNIPIQEVETSLLGLAQRVDVQVEYVTVKNPSKLPKRFPEARVFVGSDGARSVVRTDVFGDKFRLQETIQRLVQVTYHIRQNETVNLRLKVGGIIEHGYRTIASMHTTLIDERTSQKQGRTEKTLTFAVPNPVFAGMDGATFPKPFTLATPELPLKIRDDFYLWCGMKEEIYGEVRIPDSEKFTGIDGEARISKLFIKAQEEGRVWCLLGDAAASFPLQRGFNVGFKCGIQLAQTIVNFYNTPNAELVTADGIEGMVPAPFAAYAAFGITIEDQELCFLNCPLDKKRRGIGLWKFATTVGKALPSIANLDNRSVQRFLDIGKNPGQTPMGQISSTKALVSQRIQEFDAAIAAQQIEDDGQPIPEKIQNILAAYDAYQAHQP